MNGRWYHQVILYGLPGLPLAMLGLPLYVYLPTFYTNELGLPLSVVGAALLAARLLDVLTDPLIGWLNDRLQIGWGRRKVFITLGTPLLLLGVEFLLRPSTPVSGWYLFFWSLFAYLGWTCINIPWQAWGAEISNDYHDKTTLAASREGFTLLGTIVVVILPLMILNQPSQADILSFMTGLLWWLLPLCILPALLGLVERRPLRRFNPLLQVGKIFSVHPALHYLLPAYFLNSVANALPATLFLLFVSHVLQTSQYSGLLLMVYFLSGVIGLPWWLWLARRLDKSRSWTLALLLSIAGFVWVPLLGSGDIGWFIAICAVSGFALGADMALPASIQADIAQHMQQQGNPHTGLLFGFWGLLTKLALALAVGIAFPLLDWAGFEQNASTQTTAAWMTLLVLYAGLPVLLKGWVIWRMWRFPFSAIDFRDCWERSYVSALYPVSSTQRSSGVQQHED